MKIKVTRAGADALASEISKSAVAVQGLSGIIVATADGRRLAVSENASGSPDRIAALAATLISMGGTAAKELGGGAAAELVVNFQGGTLICLRLQPDNAFVMAVVASGSASLGIVLSHARLTASRIGPMLESFLVRE